MPTVFMRPASVPLVLSPIWLDGVPTAVINASLSLLPVPPTTLVNVPSSLSAAISAAPCVAGEGPGCADAAEENPLVKRLQENSRKNKEVNNQEMREKYWKKGCVRGHRV